MELTELEREWISMVFDDGTGWLDDTGVDYNDPRWKGVKSSLFQKGVIVEDYDDGEDYFFAASEYEHLFDVGLG